MNTTLRALVYISTLHKSVKSRILKLQPTMRYSERSRKMDQTIAMYVCHPIPTQWQQLTSQVGFLGTVALMMKTQIGLGVLSIPAAFDALGLVPGVVCLCAIAGITTWSDYIIGTFKLRHREVYGIDDAGQLMFGRFGKEVFGGVFCLCECTSSDQIRIRWLTM